MTHPIAAKMAACDPSVSLRRTFGVGAKAGEPVESKGLTIVHEPWDGFIPAGTGATIYGRGSGEGLDSNVVMAPVEWIMRTFTEAEAGVQRRREDTRVGSGRLKRPVWEWATDHAADLLIDKPNDFYDGDALWKATCISYVLNGNAYWLKVRNSIGDVIELWYIPHWLIQPKWPPDGSRFISHYEYNTGYAGAKPQRLPPRDVVHFRFGLDPRNMRLGLSPLRALLLEVFVDDEAANFSAKSLRNMGVPGLVVAPKLAPINPSDEDIEKLKHGFEGDNVGSTVILKMPTDLHQFGFDANKIMLGSLRDISEERVCATLGIPAAVVGFGSGLQSTKVGATMRELVRLAWVQCIIPMQTTLGRQLTTQLLPDFVAQTKRFRMRFDDSEVSAFQEEADLKAKRVGGLVQQGILRIDRAQEMLSLEVDEHRKLYLQPSNSMPIDEQGDPIKEALPNGAATDDGGDGPDDEEIPPAVAARRAGRNGSTPDKEED
jgi:HK97 family phage portal protein